MGKIVVITGASSGFGAMSARHLADAGHTVYAGMRDTAGRNQKAAGAATQYAKEHGVDLRPIELDVSEYEQHYAGLSQQVADRLAALAPPNADPTEVARAVVAAVDAPEGKRPYRVHVDPADDGSGVVSAVADHIRAEFLNRVGLADLLRA